MARGINSVLLIGALTRDPELRYTPNGAAVLSITVAGDSVVTDIGSWRRPQLAVVSARRAGQPQR